MKLIKWYLELRRIAKSDAPAVERIQRIGQHALK